MSLVTRLEQTAFHDSTISDFRWKNSRIRLEFENVIIDTADDNYYRAIVDLGGVHSVTRDGKPVDTLSSEGEDSSVLEFRRRDQTITLVVIWRSYLTRTEKVCTYSIGFDTFELQGEQQPGCI